MRNEKLKEVVKSILIVFLLLVLFIMACYHETHYTRNGCVVGVSDGVVTVKDNSSNLWEFNGNGYEVGQNVSLYMYTNHTNDIIEDDVILEVN